MYEANMTPATTKAALAAVVELRYSLFYELKSPWKNPPCLGDSGTAPGYLGETPPSNTVSRGFYSSVNLLTAFIES